jgi:ATP-dependent DNA ligase
VGAPGGPKIAGDKNAAANPYLQRMFEFCLPTGAKIVPDGPDWIHEIKYDGYRLRVERDGDRVRLITRGGYDWTKRYTWIVEATRRGDPN